MRRELNKWSLVVVGHWNTAILSPDWLAKEVFRQNEIQIMYPVLGGGHPIFEAADMRIIVSQDRVAFIPLKDDADLLNRIESSAIHVLGTLPHTPVSAFGENFQYIIEEPTKQLEEVYALKDADKLNEQGTLIEKAIRRSLDRDGRRLNLTIMVGEVVRIELNYHYTVTNAKQALERMENTCCNNRNDGLSLLKTIYDLTLSEGA